MNNQQLFPRLSSLLLMAFLALFITLSGCNSDDDPGPDCDTENVTYAGTVAPIMASRCNSCHSGSSPSAGINTSTHAGLSGITGNRLLGSIKHQSDFSPMPQGGSKLTSCQISQIEAWVSNGKPNN